MGFFDTLLYPFWWFNSTIMVGFESLFTALGMSESSGWTWALSIVGLVVVLRVLLMPLFVRQIRAQRRMQMLQPELMKIQAKYKGKKDEASRRAMTEETFALYKKHGTNPFSSCLPILMQMPFFFALFRMLNTVPQVAAGEVEPVGFFTRELAIKMNEASIFGASLNATFLHDNDVAAKILAVVLIVAMSVTTFITQHQLMRKNMPAAALDNPMARQQKMLLYILPIIFAVTGVNFPIGVLIYWTTTNLWTMGQQFVVIRAMPAPGSPAEKARQERLRAKGKPVEAVRIAEAEGSAPEGDGSAARGGQRMQPRSKKRARAGNRPKGRR
jgi:YidC/Oxa1 family membrane protein insertase